MLSSLVTKKWGCLHTFSIILLLWLCSSNWTVFGQLPAWHHPLPAVFSGCWPAPVQVYSDHSTMDGGGGPGGWLRGWWWADISYVIWCGQGIDFLSLKLCIHYFWKPYIPYVVMFIHFYLTQYDLAHSCWNFSDSNKPKSTQTSFFVSYFILILFSWMPDLAPVLYFKSTLSWNLNITNAPLPHDQFLYLMYSLLISSALTLILLTKHVRYRLWHTQSQSNTKLSLINDFLRT